MNWTGNEKRRFPRAKFPCKIIIITGGEAVTSHTENVSTGGIRVIVDKKMRVFDKLCLELFVKENEPIQCEGMVIWVKEIANPVEQKTTMYDVGIAFSGIHMADKDYLDKMVITLLNEQKESSQEDQ